MIGPYNVSLKSFRKREREMWAHRVAVALSSKYGGIELDLFAYAGREYTDPLQMALCFVSPVVKATFETPLTDARRTTGMVQEAQTAAASPVPHLSEL